MSELVANGAAVVSAVIEAHREGAWTADLVLDSASVPSGMLDVTDASGTVLLRGYVLRAEAPYERAEVRLVGGTGRLGTILAPRYYRGAQVRTILADVARESGSTLADDLGADVSRELAAWVRVGGEDVVSTLRHLLRAALPKGWTWRTRYDGSLWLGADEWLDVIAPGVEVVSKRPARGEVEVGAVTVAELLAIEPGMVFEGLDVASIRIDARPDRLRAVIRTHAQARTAGDVVTSGIQRLAREATCERALLAMYEARVVQQETSGLVALEPQPDLAEALRTIPSLTKVPLIAPYPGAKVLFPASSVASRSVRVLVGFANGDPSKPYAVPWALAGTTPDRVEINAGSVIALGGDAKGVARADDTVGRNAAMQAWMDAVAAAFAGLGVTLTPIVGGTIGTITSASPKLKTG